MSALREELESAGQVLLNADSLYVWASGRLVLTGASLRLRRAEVHVVVGRNGAGKSTMLRAVVGESAARSGLLTIAATRLHRWGLSALTARGLWWWPQGGLLSRGISPRDHVELLRTRRPDIWSRFDAVSRELELEDPLRHARVEELSTGERRAFEAALMLAAAPQILVADEPFTALSPALATRLAAGLGRLAASGSAICVSTHELWLMDSIADRVSWLNAGTLRELGQPSEARNDWQFQREFLGGSS